MLSFQFGISAGYLIPFAGAGSPPSPAFPQRLLTIESAEVNITRKIEKLMGQNIMPDDAAPSDEEIKIKLSVGRIGMDLWNTMLGETVTAGYKRENRDEGGPGGTAIPTTPYQITVVNAATFYKDLGVLNAATLQPMAAVTGTPAAGQYAVNSSTGVYTFSAADEASGVKVLISYLDTPASGGRTLTRINHPQGYGPINNLVIAGSYTSAGAVSPFGVLNLRAVRLSGPGAPFKRNGYLLTPIEGEGFPDASGSAWDLWSPA
jgi:hypothetical protein